MSGDSERHATSRDRETTADGSESGERPTVLVVDDEARVCQAFELWLDESYRVVTATDGETALERLDARTDVVLLDRHMPGLSGDEVLDRIREGDHDPRVAMVTAVDPDFDIVDMPFDHYVSKPVDGEALGYVVERLLELDRYDGSLSDFYAVTEKIATLEAEKTRHELGDSEEYAALVERRKRLETEVNDRRAAVDDVDRLFEMAAESNGADER
jgi:CheY-like chemotaxis protein